LNSSLQTSLLQLIKTVFEFQHASRKEELFAKPLVKKMSVPGFDYDRKSEKPLVVFEIKGSPKIPRLLNPDS